MAFFFQGTPFDKEYLPHRLGNWAVPRWSPSKARELEFRPSPNPITDMNGRFLPGAPRGTSGPFGHYVGTWDLPRRITRENAKSITKEPPDGRFHTWLHPVKRQIVRKPVGRNNKTPLRATLEKPPGEKGGTPKDEKDKDEKAEEKQEDAREDVNSQMFEGNEVDNNKLNFPAINNTIDKSNLEPYVPGNITDPKQRHESYAVLESKYKPKEKQLVPESLSSIDNHETEDMKTNERDKRTKLPNVYDPSYARKKHVENLKHEPLPDKMYYNHFLTNEELNVKPHAVIVRGPEAKTPFSCTKLKVYRPKTCVKTEPQTEEKRPATTNEKRGPSLIDLAMGWDIKTNEGLKQPKHIDGSNGCSAPAVFTLIKTPKHDEKPVKTHSKPIFTRSNVDDKMSPSSPVNFDKDMSNLPRKDSCEVQNCPQHKQENIKRASSTEKQKNNSAFDRKSNSSNSNHSRRANTDAENVNNANSHHSRRANTDAENVNSANSHHSRANTEVDNAKINTELLKHKTMHQSSPNLSISPKNSSDSGTNTKHKTCVSCHGSKASSSSSNKSIKVPKMKVPFPKKNYTIDTLIPPYSMRGNIGYPEHWRLASVYQLSFKLPELRKVPLISCVFK